MRMEFPEIVWQRSGKPDKIALGPRVQREDWAKYAKGCPKILEVADHLLQSFAGQHVEVKFGDILDYREDQIAESPLGLTP